MATTLSNEWSTVVIVFDAALDTSRTYTAQATSHPVETGVQISDHVTLENPKFSLKGVVSDAAFLSIGDQVSSFVGGILGALGIADKESRSLSALQDIVSLWKSREFVTLQYGNEPVYENLILTKVNVPKDQNINDAYVFDLEFEQIKTVSSRYTTVQATRVTTTEAEGLSTSAANKGHGEPPVGGKGFIDYQNPTTDAAAKTNSGTQKAQKVAKESSGSALRDLAEYLEK